MELMMDVELISVESCTYAVVIGVTNQVYDLKWEHEFNRVVFEDVSETPPMYCAAGSKFEINSG